MTRAELTAELPYCESMATFHESQAKRYRDRVDQLNQQLATLDSGTLTQRQIERYPVVRREGPWTGNAATIHACNDAKKAADFAAKQLANYPHF